MSSNKKIKKQIKSKQRKNSKITKRNKFSKELEEEFFKDMKMDIKDDFIDPMDNLFNFEDIEEKMFKNNFNLLLDKEEGKHPRKKSKKNYKDGTVFSRVYCSSYNNINGKEHEEKYKSESMKQMNNGRNISECKESYKNSDGVCKTSLQRGLDKKGQKVIREKNIKTGENKEHKIYKGMKENEINIFDKEYNDYSEKIGFKKNYQNLRSLGTFEKDNKKLLTDGTQILNRKTKRH